MWVKKADNAAGSGARDRTLIATGAIGAALAAICCLTPLLAFLLLRNVPRLRPIPEKVDHALR